MFDDEDFCFDEQYFVEEEFDDEDSKTSTEETINFDEFDHSINFSNDEYCKTTCEFFKTCYANHDSCIKESFENMLKTITPREAKVLKMRHGWYNCINFSHSQIGHEFDVSKGRVQQIEAKALQKLRHPSRYNKSARIFLYDIFLLPEGNFYKSLSLAILGDFGKEIAFEVELGIDYSIVDKEKTSNKSINDIKKELNANIHDITLLDPYALYLDKLNITTLDHLLHTSELSLFTHCFNKDDQKLFKLLKTLSNMGYRLKNGEFPSSNLNEHYSKDLKDLIFDSSIFEERLLDLPSKIVFKLFEEEIKTNDDLVTRIFYVNSLHNFTKEEHQIIDNYLASKNLLCYLDESHTKKIYISSLLFNAFVDNLVVWFRDNCVSISSFKNNLLESENISIVSLFELLKNKFDTFEFASIVDFLSIADYNLIDLNLSVRTHNILSKAGFCTLQDIISKSVEDLSQIKNIGKKGINEIVETLTSLGLELNEDNYSETL